MLGNEVILIRIFVSVMYVEFCKFFVVSGDGVDRCFVLLNVLVSVVIKIFKYCVLMYLFIGEFKG